MATDSNGGPRGERLAFGDDIEDVLEVVGGGGEPGLAVVEVQVVDPPAVDGLAGGVENGGFWCDRRARAGDELMIRVEHGRAGVAVIVVVLARRGRRKLAVGI